MKSHRFPPFLILFIGLLLLALTSCTQGVQGIFAELESEVAIATNNLGNGNMQGMTRASVNGSDSYVVIKGIGMFFRDVEDGRWQRLNPPADYGLAQFVTTVTVGGTDHLYAVFAGDGGSITYTLRRRVNNQWSGELFSVSGFGRITGLAAEGSTLYVSASNDSSSSGTTHLFASDRSQGSNAITAVGNRFPSGGASTDNDLRKVVKTTGGTGRTWIVSRRGLFELNGTNLDAVEAPAEIRDVEKLDENTLVAVTTGGGVFTVDVTGGAPNAATDWTSRATSSNRLTSVTRVSDSLIVIGTEASQSTTSRGRGFFDGTFSGTGANVTITLSPPLGNYRSTQMQLSSLNGFFIDTTDPAAPRLFVLTVANDRGLYRADNYSHSDAIRWEME
jgi:hypothetical protein